MYKIVCILLSCLFSILLVSAITSSVLNTLDNRKSKKPNEEQIKVAEWRLANTQEIQGIVVSKNDKSYIKKEDTILFMGGGERKVENYQLKIQYGDHNFKTIKVKEKDYLNNNKNDNINIVINEGNNEIKYNLQDQNDKEVYTKYKRLVR
ncbi:hypothetical protein M4L39_13665 [Staphylococcus equorum]|uniref:hypothetical protein n=1 Tax=Staphylococcus equorum TaxID=246432 RepID=UPI0024083453|nr:hypothetical protein [Staphylococcus equorum]MDG0844461.1 hypothetical protein [Staphylococcus equorum]